MSKFEIRKYGDPILRKKTQHICEITEYIKNLCNDMLETMYSVSGVGLAAPQIGVSLRLCVVDVDPNKESPFILINPKIIGTENKVEGQEGCLSFPGFYEKVKRFESIEIEFLSIDGLLTRLKAKNYFARAVQHEVDHLDCKLFIDYLPDWKKRMLEKEIRKRKKMANW
ncbi:MAG: peptide deformylase [Elusimicrobiota bacterium]|jgi:peptide deformylase|nr:peptide deformylase [Elusimicrobiota bacterium]